VAAITAYNKSLQYQQYYYNGNDVIGYYQWQQQRTINTALCGQLLHLCVTGRLWQPAADCGININGVPAAVIQYSAGGYLSAYGQPGQQHLACGSGCINGRPSAGRNGNDLWLA